MTDASAPTYCGLDRRFAEEPHALIIPCKDRALKAEIHAASRKRPPDQSGRCGGVEPAVMSGLAAEVTSVGAWWRHGRILSVSTRRGSGASTRHSSCTPATSSPPVREH